jgi:hypothetical protein
LPDGIVSVNGFHHIELRQKNLGKAGSQLTRLGEDAIDDRRQERLPGIASW